MAKDNANPFKTSQFRISRGVYDRAVLCGAPMRKTEQLFQRVRPATASCYSAAQVRFATRPVTKAVEQVLFCLLLAPSRRSFVFS